MAADQVGLIAILGAPLAGATLLALWRGLGHRAVGGLAGAAAAISLVGSLALLPGLRQGVVPTATIALSPAGMGFRLCLDWLSFPYVLTAAGVTLLAVIYAWGYHHPDARTPYFYALLLLFSAGMVGTTLADDLILFYTFWELMLIASCALIVEWGEGERRGAVALKYFVVTHLGSLLILAGLVMLYDAAGTTVLSALRAGVAMSPAQARTAIVLLIVGFCVKMAIFPLHFWLPDAHGVAPMPVTIMLAAAMLSMGTYGILRFPLGIFDRAQAIPLAVPLMVAGIVSEVYGALMALAESDIKRIVAYSSVSQMGYILFGLGTLTRAGAAGATLHVMYHAIAKSLLFMSVGMVIRATGRRQIARLGGLSKPMPLATLCTAIGVLTLVGAPPLCIFASEWMIFAGGFQTTHVGMAAVALLGSLFTVAYALWFVGRVFFVPPTEPLPAGVGTVRMPRAMMLPAVFLAVLAIATGIVTGPPFDWANRALALIWGGSW
jgi:NADH-quinone oxidoreductase subunit M